MRECTRRKQSEELLPFATSRMPLELPAADISVDFFSNHVLNNTSGPCSAWEDEDDEEIYLKNLEEDGEDLHDEKDSANTSPLSALGTNVKPYLEGGAYSRLHSAAPSGTRRPVTPSFKLESIVEREHEHSSLGPDGFM